MAWKCSGLHLQWPLQAVSYFCVAKAHAHVGWARRATGFLFFAFSSFWRRGMVREDGGAGGGRADGKRWKRRGLGVGIWLVESVFYFLAGFILRWRDRLACPVLLFLKLVLCCLIRF